MEIDIKEIDWRVLRVQKTILSQVCEFNSHLTENEYQALEGLVGLLDLLQDTAVESQEVPETDVFTHAELRSHGWDDLGSAPWVLVGETDKDWLDMFVHRDDAVNQKKILEVDYNIKARIISGEQYRKANGITERP